MSFRIGQKVVCIVPVGCWRCFDGEICPQKGEVYTVRATFIDESDGAQMIQLEEIINAPRQYDDIEVTECRFDACGFRPLIERKTDISIFTSLLDPANHKPLPEQKPKRQKVSHDLCGNE